MGNSQSIPIPLNLVITRLNKYDEWESSSLRPVINLKLNPRNPYLQKRFARFYDIPQLFVHKNGNISSL